MTLEPMLLALPFPEFLDPVIFEIGPFALRWYALAYIAGLALGWLYLRRIAVQPPAIMSRQDADDLLFGVTLGVILGGRLGYVLFYKPLEFLAQPWKIVFVWEGGMAFHGGLIGVAVAIVLFARARKLALFSVADLVVAVAPIGLFFGRLANFVNAELWGRVSDVAWAVVFPDPRAGGVPRHPSQLYEAALEGLVLFILLWYLRRFHGMLQRPGALTGVFSLGYAASRIVVEFFRQPDAHLGFLVGGATMGQLLSLPLAAFGLYLLARAYRRPAAGP